MVQISSNSFKISWSWKNLNAKEETAQKNIKDKVQNMGMEFLQKWFLLVLSTIL